MKPNKFRAAIFVLMLNYMLFSDDINQPVVPQVSQITDKKISILDYNIEYKKQSGTYHKAYCSTMANINLAELSWLDQGPPDDLSTVKSIFIVSYQMIKKIFDNNPLAIIYYMPYEFEIQLKNKKIIKTKGSIKGLESFYVSYINDQNEQRNTKCYTYFVRYWLEDKGCFADNSSKDYNNQPTIPNDVVRFIEIK